ncbi:hypothetical protein R6Q59_029874, partial [Mikania micrantha]
EDSKLTPISPLLLLSNPNIHNLINLSQVYLGEQYVNNPTLSVVTFLIKVTKTTTLATTTKHDEGFEYEVGGLHWQWMWWFSGEHG